MEEGEQGRHRRALLMPKGPWILDHLWTTTAICAVLAVVVVAVYIIFVDPH